MTSLTQLRSDDEVVGAFAMRPNSCPAVRQATVSTASRILIVDDNQDLQQLLGDYLQEQGFDTASAKTRAEMEAEMEVRSPSLILLDLRLGIEAGLDILRDLRTRSQIPVIIMTGHGRDEVDRVVGLELGADDYLTKPFSYRELVARIRTILRRRDAVIEASNENTASDRFEFEGWMLDRKRRRLTDPNKHAVALTRGEYSLLCAFVDAPGRPLSREFLLQVTRLHENLFDRSIDVQVLRLRRKLEADPARPRLIRTERGLGYVFSAKVRKQAFRSFDGNGADRALPRPALAVSSDEGASHRSYTMR